MLYFFTMKRVLHFIFSRRVFFFSPPTISKNINFTAKARYFKDPFKGWGGVQRRGLEPRSGDRGGRAAF